MKKILSIFTLISIMIGCTSQNPFLNEWENPYGIPDYGKIQEKHYEPALIEAIERHSEEIDAIISNTAEPTFDNVILAYEQSGALLDKVVGVLFNLSETDLTPTLQVIVEKAISMMTEHNNNIFMNAEFYKKVSAVYEAQDKLDLTREQQMVLKKIYESFESNGIALDQAGQARMREINTTLAGLEQKFGNNILSQNNSFKLIIDKKEDLAGLPEFVLNSGKVAAKSANLAEGEYLYTLHVPSYIPFMTYNQNRELRKEMFTAYSQKGNNNDSADNKALIMDIMKLRIEKAKLLGFDSPADFILSNKMAKEPQIVDTFLADIFASAVKRAELEIVDMQAIMDKDIAAGLVQKGAKIEPWDWDYYAERVRVEKYALNEDEIKPYFKMENVREGVFMMANKLWDLKFRKLEDAPLYHPDVEVFEVTDADNSLIGYLSTDYFPRASKRGGAWMNNIRNQEFVGGKDVRPIIVNVGNFTKPTETEPSLLSLDEVSTLFHEFGHALHGLLSQCHYKSVSGTSVARDFVELPSQICENWALAPELLAEYAVHYKTGEPIPSELVEKINNSGTFNQGFMTTELLAAAILDMEWHKLESISVPADSEYASDTMCQDNPDLRIIDPIKFEEVVMKKAGLIEEIIPRYRSTYFNHIFAGGYSAGYYGYLWAEVLDKDAFEYFTEKGIFNKEVATSFRENILEKGGSEEPMILYKKFRGQEPDPKALVRARGL